MKVVIIEWLDSCGAGSRWQFLEDYEDPKPLKCRSIGWLVQDREDCKVIVPHLSMDAKDSQRQGCGEMTIPTRSIILITEITLPP